MYIHVYSHKKVHNALTAVYWSMTELPRHIVSLLFYLFDFFNITPCTQCNYDMQEHMTMLFLFKHQ